MVSASDDGMLQRIVICPNRSADWRANLRLLAFLFAVSLCIGTGFALVGAWMILPFAGIELLALGAALYYVNWRLTYREVITLGRGAVHIVKGVYRPREEWHFALEHATVSVRDSTQPRARPLVSLCHLREEIDIGGCLGDEELEDLLAQLRATGLRVRHHGAPGKRRF